MQEQIAKPAASKFLEGFVVLFCGIDEDRRAKAKEAVARYGGKCVDKYNNTVTCGIVGRVGSSGFKDMLNAKVRLLTFKWLQDCMLSRSLAPMEQPQYKVNIFTGLNVVCTQLNQDERTRIQQLVESGGGTYSDKLFGNICTHLIAKTPDGEKYMGAKKFGTVKIVVMAWAEECVKQKVWVPELEYSVDIIARQALKEAQARKHKSQQAAIAAAAALAQPSKSSEEEEEMSLVEQMESCLLREFASGWLPSCRSVSGAQEQVFAQEVFWVQGYSREVTDYATACILAGGGQGSMVLCDAVTTVLLGPKAHSSEWTLVRRHPCGVAQVNLVWLVETLFGLDALVALFREKAPLQDFMQGVSVRGVTPSGRQSVEEASNMESAVSSMEELSAAYAAYVRRRKASVPAACASAGRPPSAPETTEVAAKVSASSIARSSFTNTSTGTSALHSASAAEIAVTQGGALSRGLAVVSQTVLTEEDTALSGEATEPVARKRRKA